MKKSVNRLFISFLAFPFVYVSTNLITLNYVKAEQDVNTEPSKIKNTNGAMEIKKPSKEQIKEQLNPIQYNVTQEDGTEPPFQNPYWDNKKPGIYVDVVTGEALFSSLDKYDSGTGWPSFTKPIKKESVETHTDFKMILPRTEVRSKIGDSHLGHVFNDGPKEAGGKRYCMNSAAFKFIPSDELINQGYGEYAYLFEVKKNDEQPKALNQDLQEIVLAGGCFWGMEDLLRAQKGILEIEVGYAGGEKDSATYQNVKTGVTGHAESVRIKYDPTQLNLESLLEFFFKIHDPTTLNRQGNDIGTQYRSAIFTTSKEQSEIAQKVKDKVQLSGVWKKDLTTEIQPLKGFYRAEAYHQDYLEKNPGGYTCHYFRDVKF